MTSRTDITPLQVNDHITAGMKATYNVSQAPTQLGMPGAPHGVCTYLRDTPCAGYALGDAMVLVQD